MSKGETRPHIGYLLSALFGFVESDAEAEQRQAHFDRFLVRVLHGDLELATGSHGGNELVGERHCDEAPKLVQVWIACRSGAPLPTLTKTGSVRLRPSGSVMSMAPLLPSAAGRTVTETSNCRDSRWKTCCTARQSSVLPSPVHSTRHAAGGFSGDCFADADREPAPTAISNAIAVAIISPRLPASEARELADMGAHSSRLRAAGAIALKACRCVSRYVHETGKHL